MTKLIVVDVDGTLVNSNSQITERTKKALIRASKEGHKVMIASGRPTSGIYALAKALKFDEFGGLISSFNGGMLYDYKEKKILANHPMDLSLAKEILEFSKNLDLELMVPKGDYIITDDASKYYPSWESENLGVPLKEDKTIRDTIDFEPNKFLFAADPEKIDGPRQKLIDKFGDRTYQVQSLRFYHEVMPLGLSKGNSVLEACKILGIDTDDILIFGDEMNDVTMFEIGGTRVAMGNAVDHIKEIADHITLSNDEDGIAAYLEEYLFKEI